MATLNKSSARTQIDVAEASEIARMARGSDPNILSREDMESLLGNSALVLDALRRRPRYFDGRFLTGADLTRDQDYIRQRQADLARATGTGVVAGLEVRLSGTAGSELLVISPGHGVTPSGDIVMVMTERSVAPLDLAAVERLDATMGLRLAPRVPLGRRTGLFLLVLRGVEFSANPIAAYPTSITGPRQVEEGDVIEATAITLIPYPNIAGTASLAEGRRAVARQLFLGDPVGMPQDALPLAMIGMEKGAIRWIDTAMVRRETGADTPLQVSMGARPRALSEAFLLQHRRHLRDVLTDRAAGGLPFAFAAAQYFSALPAAGQLPAAAILPDPLGFRQLWFPPAVDVDLSFVPSDEIAALVEESLTLPPIDLLGDPQDLDATGIVVFAPVTRQRLQRFENALAKLTMTALPDPSQGIRRPPARILAALLARRTTKQIEAATRDAEAVAAAATADAETKAWQAAWAEAVAAIPTEGGMPPLLWYIRRRAVPYESRVSGIAVPVSGDDAALKTSVDARLATLALTDRVSSIGSRATPFAQARMYALLGSPRILNSTVLMASAIHDLEAVVASIPTTSTPTTTGTPTGTSSPPTTPTPTPATTTTPTATPPGAITPATTPIITRPIPVLTPTRPLPGPLVDPVAPPRTSPIVLTRDLRAAATWQLLDEGDVIDVASRYGDPALGDGLDRITATLKDQPLDQDGQLWLGGTGQALDLDRVVRNASAAALPKIADDLRKAVVAKSTDDLAQVIAAVH